MLRIVDLRGHPDVASADLRRSEVAARDVRDSVREILDQVRTGGDATLVELTRRFDAVSLDPDDLVVGDERLDAALDGLDRDLRAALERAAEQIRWFHEHARPRDWTVEEAGRRVGQRFRPIRRVGVYVPGGLGAYPSTVLMTVVPAQVAGVDEIVLCTPPTGGDGWPDTTVLAAARLAGADRVVRVGGAQAVAAMAYGTASVPACDKIVGPGNVYVATAKQLVLADGRCGIDTVAGPTEIAIIADDTAAPQLLAADLVAQAEHDELATCVLVTTASELVAPVEAALAEEVAATRHHERVATALANQGLVVIVDDLDAAVTVVDRFAPEHLEIQTRDPREVAERVRFAGAVFVGPTSPVSLGDYAAGPNHTLPTAGTARFAGGLTTSDFLVPVNLVEYGREELSELAPVVRALAEAEDLPAHARAVDLRLETP